MTLTVPSAQLVLVTVPALESTVVVPEALQFQIGALAKLPVHWVASTFTEGGRSRPVDSQPFATLPSQSSEPLLHAAHAPAVQVCDVEQEDVEHVVPQLVSRLTCFSQPFSAEPSHSSVPAGQATHAPLLQVCVLGVQATAVLHCPLAEHVWTPLPEHCFVPGTHTPVHAPVTHADETHGESDPQAPLAEHVSMALFEHCTALGAHTPAQAPLTQA